MNKKEIIEKLKNNMPKFTGTEEEIEVKTALYIYMELGKIKSFDEKYYFGNSETRRKIYDLAEKQEENIEQTVSKRKLGIESDDIVEIIDLRYQKEQIVEIIDNKNIFPGYHMNKKSWITIKLDNSVDTKQIYKLIDNSYKISIGNKCGLAGDTLSQKVYDYLTTIPKGKVVTYKQVAEHLGNKGLARVVGNVLHKNPDGDKYPCYKVLNAKGELAECFVFGGKSIQKKRLENDGIKVINNMVDLKLYQWKE